jgi:hypothetical protein
MEVRLHIMDSRNGCALLLFLIIVLCVVIVNTPPLTPQDREAMRAYEARKKIESSMDVLNELAKMEIESRPVMRQTRVEAEYQQPAPSLPPAMLSR